MQLEIRAANPADAEAVAALHVEGWQEFRSFVPTHVMAARTLLSRTAEWLVRLSSADPGTWTALAERESEVVGFIHCALLEQPILGARSEIKYLYTTARLRRQGIGRALLASAARWLAERGGEPISLYSLGPNSFRAAYSYLGGTIVGERPTRWDDTIIPETCYRWPTAEALIAACERPAT